MGSQKTVLKNNNFLLDILNFKMYYIFKIGK